MRKISQRRRQDGTTQTWYQDNDGTHVFKTEGDFTSLYEQNAAKRTDSKRYKYTSTPDDYKGREVAEIDNMTILRWKQEGFDFFDYTNPNRGAELKKRLVEEPWLLTTDKRFELK